MSSSLPKIVPVLPSSDIARDVAWYRQNTGFEPIFSDPMYAALRRDDLEIHLQWHANTADDPLLGGSVIRVFVEDIEPVFDEFVQRGSVAGDSLRRQTAWQTHEFGIRDPNDNILFFVQDC